MAKKDSERVASRGKLRKLIKEYIEYLQNFFTNGV